MNTPEARNALGKYGEDLAARRLTETGMTVLARNWRGGRTGEIDIVARDGDALVVCEVKTRKSGPSSTRWRPSPRPRRSACVAWPSAGSRNTAGHHPAASASI